MSTPPMSTTGSSGRLPPTHQVAGWPSSSAGSRTPKAAGLKTCLRPTAKMYFDAIAQTEAKASAPMPRTSVRPTGLMMSATMSAVM